MKAALLIHNHDEGYNGIIVRHGEPGLSHNEAMRVAALVGFSYDTHSENEELITIPLDTDVLPVNPNTNDFFFFDRSKHQ